MENNGYSDYQPLGSKQNFQDIVAIGMYCTEGYNGFAGNFKRYNTFYILSM